MKALIGAAALLFSISANSAWLNTTGMITNLTTYSHTETILVALSNVGSDISACSDKTTFAISKSISPEARARMYSMLLAAQASGRPVVVSYSDTGGCEPWDASQNVFRQIVRLSKRFKPDS